jgi:hypothetical protein
MLASYRHRYNEQIKESMKKEGDSKDSVYNEYLALADDLKKAAGEALDKVDQEESKDQHMNAGD